MDNDDVGYSLDEAAAQVLRISMLPVDAEPALRDCIAGAGDGWSVGWIVAWWMERPLPLEVLEFTGNTVPSEPGWNAIFVADSGGLGPVVLDAADQASVCTVIDIEECF